MVFAMVVETVKVVAVLQLMSMLIILWCQCSKKGGFDAAKTVALM